MFQLTFRHRDGRLRRTFGPVGAPTAFRDIDVARSHGHTFLHMQPTPDLGRLIPQSTPEPGSTLLPPVPRSSFYSL